MYNSDGRFSGGSHGFIIGHVTPEAQEGGPIGLLRTGDLIRIDVSKRTIDAKLSDEEWKFRKENWRAPPLKATSGALYKFIKNTTSASHGCTTDE